MFLTFTPSGIRDLQKQDADQHEKTTGLTCQERHKVLEERYAHNPRWPNIPAVDVLMLTCDNINVVKYEANAGFLIQKCQWRHPSMALLTDDEIKVEVEKSKGIQCGCKKGCGTQACTCSKQGLPCGMSCKCAKDGQPCKNSLTTALHDKVVKEAIRTGQADQPCTAVPVPSQGQTINISRTSLGQPCVRVFSAVATSVGPVKIDYNDWAPQDYIQTVGITGLNPEDVRLETCQLKHAPAICTLRR